MLSSIVPKSRASPPRVSSFCDDEKVDGDDEKGASQAPSESGSARVPLRTTFALVGAGLGVIYGDIGTSPLYTLSGIFPSSGEIPSNEDVIGAISAIIWALTLVPLLKYCLIALDFGNGGHNGRVKEGGPMALYSALYPPKADNDENRALTSFPTFSEKLHTPTASFFEHKWIRNILLGVGIFGASLTMSDGMLTPAVSVVSAVGGIAIAVPSVASSTVPISIAILVVLFLFQAIGTQRVGYVFAPVLVVFFLIIAISGCINIAQYPGVFRAFDPSRAVMWFVRTKNFDNLAGVLLAITGSEAMFANLGQFSKQSIRLGFIGFIYPSLLLAYLGQGAKFIRDPETVIQNVFYNSIPGGAGGGLFWLTYVFAILAAIIASQAMISATFSLVQQLVNFHAMPSVKIIHTSSYFQGQVFIPIANILIAAGTIGFTAGFGTGIGLTNAYGFAVSTVFIVTTTFIAISIVRIKHLPIPLAIAFLVFFGFIDALFFGASLKKVPEGAYAPLAIGIIITAFLLFWSWARGLEDEFDANNRSRLTDIIRRVDEEVETDGEGRIEEEVSSAAGLRLRLPAKARNAITDGDKLQLSDGSVPLNRLPIFAFFHNQSGNSMDGTPHSFAAFLKCYPSMPQVIVFFSILVVGEAYTNEDERYVVSRVRSFDGIYIAKLFVGYRDVVDLTNIAKPIFEEIKSLERSSDRSDSEERIASIEAAMTQSVTHILPHFHVVAKKGGNKIIAYFRKFLIESLYRRLQTEETASYLMDEEAVLRMGVTAAL